MDLISDLFTRLHEFAAGADTWQQVLALVLAGAIPFIESYLGSFLGVAAGVPPALAVAAAVAGNIICTFALVAGASRVRSLAIRNRVTAPASGIDEAPSPERSRARTKVATYADRFGVPGVCLLGPIVVASQITAPALIAIGASRRSVYLFQAISILAWGILFGFFGEAAMRWLA